LKKCEVDIAKLVELGISVEAYVVLFCKRYNNEDLLLEYVKKCSKISTESLDKLLELDYITTELIDDKYVFSKIKLTDKTIALFPDKMEVKEWIDNWYSLWPKGVKSGNFYVKTDPKECLKKMERFIKEHPQYTKGIILTATKKYLDSIAEKDYAYCKLAPYFIYKDGMSMLEGYCSEVHRNVNKPEENKSWTKGNIEAI
jgi:hypothetical protein